MVAALDDIEKLAATDVNDLGRRPTQGAELALAGEQRFVQPQPGDRRETVRVLDEHVAVDRNRVHHRVPITAQIERDLADRAAVASDLDGRPLRRQGRQRTPRRRDLGLLLSGRAPACRATPTLLAPHQPHRTTEHRQIDQLHLTDTVAMKQAPAHTCRPGHARGDHDPQPAWPLADTDHMHIGQANQQCAHARRIRFQQGLLETRRR